MLTNPLSRRADTVHAALVRDGVPDNVIAEAWRGKESPAVPTPNGLHEPRNRRVEIVESQSRRWFRLSP
jgi:outer membrane protein OmpA-like peptidoglycan-associated protein